MDDWEEEEIQSIPMEQQSMDIKYVVTTARGTEQEKIFYVGDLELQARKRYNELPENVHKEIVRATVKMCKIFGYEIIESISVVEKIL